MHPSDPSGQRRREPLLASAGSRRGGAERRRCGDPHRPAPALLDLLGRLTGRPLTVLVPKAGHGREAVLWAAAGHDVVAMDADADARRAARRHAREARVRIATVDEDLPSLPRDLVGSFDAVWEQSCFAALGPADRRRYVQATARALKPGGLLYGLFWHEAGERPGPRDVTETCVRAYFGDHFAIRSMERVRQVPHRHREFLAVLGRRDWRPKR